jgi:hypothetical protein
MTPVIMGAGSPSPQPTKVPRRPPTVMETITLSWFLEAMERKVFACQDEASVATRIGDVTRGGVGVLVGDDCVGEGFKNLHCIF